MFVDAFLVKIKNQRSELSENLEVREHSVPDSSFTEHTLEIVV